MPVLVTEWFGHISVSIEGYNPAQHVGADPNTSEDPK